MTTGYFFMGAKSVTRRLITETKDRAFKHELL